MHPVRIDSMQMPQSMSTCHGTMQEDMWPVISSSFMQCRPPVVLPCHHIKNKEGAGRSCRLHA